MTDIAARAGKPMPDLGYENQWLKDVQEGKQQIIFSLPDQGEADLVSKHECNVIVKLLFYAIDADEWGLVLPSRSLLEDVAQKYPRDWCSPLCLGIIHARVDKNWDKAAVQLERLANLGDSEATISIQELWRNQLAMVYIERYEFGKAEKMARETLQRNSDNLIARFNLGAALVDQDRLDEGLSELQAIIRVAPNSRVGLEAS